MQQLATSPPPAAGVRTRQLIWTTAPLGRRRLRAEGFRVLRFAQVQRAVARARESGARRTSLRQPAARLLAVFRRHGRVAVIGVSCDDAASLHTVYGYLVEPAFRHGCTLLVVADRSLADLDPGRLVDPGWRYPWTLERLRHLAAAAAEPAPVRVAAPVPAWRRWWRRLRGGRDATPPIPTAPRLDREQRAAVLAGDGVVQVIAPAGSGKTTVLVERVRELQRRGTPAGRILCLSFNRDAKAEIAARLAAAGLAGVQVRSFHGLGLRILREEGRLRERIGELDDRALADLAAAAGTAHRPDAVRELVSGFKLAAMLTPAEALAGGDGADPAARVYAAYEDELARRGQLDLDDLVAKAVRLLQDDAEVRRRWQARCERVLVDEYQDIEPAQALLVGLLAAPGDSLFCVGDEDQCIYAWRRATVQRIIELDQVYPGLERHALARNYRCGGRITTASRRLIEHNRFRFRKPLRAGAPEPGEVWAIACRDRREGADLVARLLAQDGSGEVAVLARTARLLAEVADARARLGSGDSPAELATIHAAKGREWDRVILFGADEGQSPHSQALKEGGLEDERRLFYVALTRARRCLQIVCTQGCESRFLQEAGITPAASRINRRPVR
ncbi:MAG: ATP-dependent helicase [Candidatus Krumholzibacteriia bacterium]